MSYHNDAWQWVLKKSMTSSCHGWQVFQGRQESTAWDALVPWDASSPWKLTSGESVIRKKGAYTREEKKL